MPTAITERLLWEHKGRNRYPEGIWKGFNKKAAFQFLLERLVKVCQRIENIQGSGNTY